LDPGETVPSKLLHNRGLWYIPRRAGVLSPESAEDFVRKHYLKGFVGQFYDPLEHRFTH
jgi:hypothetical protein